MASRRWSKAPARLDHGAGRSLAIIPDWQIRPVLDERWLEIQCRPAEVRSAKYGRGNYIFERRDGLRLKIPARKSRIVGVEQAAYDFDGKVGVPAPTWSALA
jgi:hypothetical protein